MKPIGPRLIAAISTFISAISAILTNIITSHWNLTIAVALSTLVLAATILAWLSHTPSRHRAVITQTARRGGRIAHATIHTSSDATVRQEADHHATISHTQLRTDGATIHQYADNATITGTHINATDHTHTHNP